MSKKLSTIRTLVVAPFTIVACFIALACVIFYFTQWKIVDNFLIEDISNKMASSGVTYMEKQVRLSKTVRQMNIDYDELYAIAMTLLTTDPLATPADLDTQVEAMM